MGKSTKGELLLARQGYGPLLRRDYWAVIRRCRHTPAELMATVRRHFEAFPPRELVVFRRRSGAGRALEAGDELDIHIVGVGNARVRVIHCDAQSLTLATELPHPEAGRITFGAYRNRRGDVIFHIRSHARSRSRFYRLGFRATGEAVQTNTWIDFVQRVAAAFGEGVLGYVHAETRPCEDEPEALALLAPTFVATGG